MREPRTLIVGDVHGCADELDDLLALAGFQRGDRLILVGDMVAKGPDSAAVIGRVRELGGTSVLGNHELPILAWDRAIRDDKTMPKIKDVHRQVALALSPDDHAWLGRLPYQLALPEFDTVVVHAGFDPRVALSEQDIATMVNVRSIRENGTPTKKLEDGVPWATRWRGPTHVVFGHDAVRKAQIHPFATGLDTGCVYGGELSALELPSRKVLRVPARKEWCPL